jgi:hypothetical protein
MFDAASLFMAEAIMASTKRKPAARRTVKKAAKRKSAKHKRRG